MNTQQALQQAFQLLNQGQLPVAEQLFESILQREPQNFAALNGRGFVALQQNHLPQSAADFQQSLAVNPQQAFAQKMLGIVLGAMGQFDAAMQAFTAALTLDAKDPEVYFNRANFRFQAGQAQEALADLDTAVKLRGSYLEARSNRANLLIQLGDFARAEKDLDYLVGKVTNNPDIWVALGLVRHKVGKHQGAMQCNERALKLVPNHPDALLNSSSAMHDQGEYPTALAWAEKAISVTPQRAEVHYARAQALMAMHRFDEAIAAYSKAIELNPNYAEAWMGRGLTRARLRDLDAAVTDYERAVALRPNYDEAITNLGGVYEVLGKHSEALECLRQALTVNPNSAEANANVAGLFEGLNDLDEAAKAYEKALSLNPKVRWSLGNLQFVLAKMCKWSASALSSVDLIKQVRSGMKSSTPFPLLSTPSDLSLQRRCAEIYLSDKFPLSKGLQYRTLTNLRSDRLRIAYLSADFYNHATSFLMAELFELHDRSKFEIFGFCYGRSPKDEMRRRVADSFDVFVEVADRSDSEIAEMLRELGVQITVDLKGHTKDNRLGIFAERCAPIQVHYLGYPGTTGASFIDYLVADKTVIPPEHQGFYSEKIVYMPDCYQVNDRRRKIMDIQDARGDHGLPNDGFVFCCFNNNWKITPDVFDVWMRLLLKVEGSVLWLLEDNQYASANLKREAVNRGVQSERLIFAKRVPLDIHLARHRHADLFLDTLYCNAHTTASDALWTGLPIISKLGSTYASRVSASLLKAVDMPELVAETLNEYESMALDLAMYPERLNAFKQKLKAGLHTTALFDTPRFTKNLELAYESMWGRYQTGLEPDHIYV